MKTVIITSICWIAFIAIAYAYAVTNQLIIIPNQTGYIEVRHNDLVTTPNGFDVTHRTSLDDLVHEVTNR
jgi:hypothetical protein